ncbi:DUF805 domain-containing protein [Clostridium sp. DL1XJH146]
MNWYLDVLKKYVQFDGRARRKEYWMFILFNAIFMVLASIIDGIIGSDMKIISSLYSLAVLLPSIAVSIRRMHDIDKSGWFMLVVLIPLAGPIWYLVLVCTEGTRGENSFGQDPKEIKGM